MFGILKIPDTINVFRILKGRESKRTRNEQNENQLQYYDSLPVNSSFSDILKC
jgi:hypothetical protein